MDIKKSLISMLAALMAALALASGCASADISAPTQAVVTAEAATPSLKPEQTAAPALKTEQAAPEPTPEPEAAQEADLSALRAVLSGAEPRLSYAAAPGDAPLSAQLMSDIAQYFDACQSVSFPYIFAPACTITTSAGSIEIMPDTELHLRDERSTVLVRAGGELLETGYGLFSALSAAAAPQAELPARMSALGVFAAAQDEQSAAEKLIREQLLPVGASLDTVSRLNAEGLSALTIYELAAFDYSASIDGRRETGRVICICQVEAQGTRLYALGTAQTGGDLAAQTQEAAQACVQDIIAHG